MLLNKLIDGLYGLYSPLYNQKEDIVIIIIGQNPSAKAKYSKEPEVVFVNRKIIANANT
ncbi:hypothetical protein FACS189438_2520 [Bacteroidia bacterium]|nr:hypothetical protein FACS189438_2520 [Bacteroidia bacterium]